MDYNPIWFRVTVDMVGKLVSRAAGRCEYIHDQDRANSDFEKRIARYHTFFVGRHHSSRAFAGFSGNCDMVQ